MKATLKLVACVSVLALGASAFAAEKKSAADEIRAWFDASAADFIACNTDALGKYDAEKHTAYYPDSAALVDETSAAAHDAEKTFCEAGGKNGLTYEIAEIVMLKDVALILGSGHYTRTEPDGAVSIDTDYTFTDVVVKSGDGWKFRHSHIGAIIDMGPGEEG